jgi:hypothetical protein
LFVDCVFVQLCEYIGEANSRTAIDSLDDRFSNSYEPPIGLDPVWVLIPADPLLFIISNSLLAELSELFSGCHLFEF